MGDGVWGCDRLGPIVGGIVVTWWSWRWIFFVNLLLVGISCILSLNVPESRDRLASRRIDWPGVVCFTLFLLFLIMAVLSLDQPGAGILWAVALLSFVAFLLIEAVQPTALLDFRLFRRTSFVRAIGLIFLFCFGLMAAFVIYALYLRVVHDVVRASVLLFPLPLTAVLVSAFCSLRGRGSMSMNATLGFLLLGTGLALFARFPSFSPAAFTLLLAEVIVGAGMGLCLVSLNAIGLVNIPTAQLGVASGMLTLAQQLGYTVGTAFLLFLLNTQGGPLSLISFQRTWWEATACGLVSACMLILAEKKPIMQRLNEWLSSLISPLASRTVRAQAHQIPGERARGVGFEKTLRISGLPIAPFWQQIMSLPQLSRGPSSSNRSSTRTDAQPHLTKRRPGQEDRSANREGLSPALFATGAHTGFMYSSYQDRLLCPSILWSQIPHA